VDKRLLSQHVDIHKQSQLWGPVELEAGEPGGWLAAWRRSLSLSSFFFRDSCRYSVLFLLCNFSPRLRATGPLCL
jgi:hypothetical protein